MLLRKLTLENFRQYEGTQEIEFSVDPNKNVTLILGDNTSGKTTLIQAFRWIFFDDCNFTGKTRAITDRDRTNVITSSVRRHMTTGDEAFCRATLVFEHAGILYETSRRYDYKSTIPGDGKYVGEVVKLFYYDVNGERQSIPGGQAKLLEILPESLSEYFFFDGEKIASSRNRANVRDSINRIMGLVPLERMIAHIEGTSGRSNSVKSSLRAKMKDVPGLSELNAQIGRKKHSIDETQKNLDGATSTYKQMDSLIASLQEDMIRLESVAEKASKLKSVDQELKNVDDRIVSGEKKIINTFSDSIFESICNYVSSKLIEELDDFDYVDKGIPEMTAVSVKYILERGKCICGMDLSQNPGCVAELKELLTYLPPESIGTQIRHLTEELRNLEGRNDTKRLMSAYFESYDQALIQQMNLESERQTLMEAIGKDTDADILKRKYDNAVYSRSEAQKLQVRYSGELTSLNTELMDLEGRLSKIAEADEYNKEILKQIAYADALVKRAQAIYDESSGEILTDFRETLTEVFTAMYHGQRKIELTDEYDVRLTVDGVKLDNSKGLDTVQNFAFIATLLKIAKERSGNELSSEPYPLAMDAVFSNTDVQHIMNICKALPNLAQQSVLAIMDKDWAVAASTLGVSVGKKYKIVKKDDSHSYIEEVKL